MNLIRAQFILIFDSEDEVLGMVANGNPEELVPLRAQIVVHHLLSKNIFYRRVPWSSGYGRRLMFHRSWVRIPAPYTGWTFIKTKQILHGGLPDWTVGSAMAKKRMMKMGTTWWFLDILPTSKNLNLRSLEAAINFRHTLL